MQSTSSSSQLAPPSHKLNTMSSPGEDTTPITLSITERMAVLAINKQNKEIERLVVWSALAELILAERISTYDLNTNNDGHRRRPSGPKSYAAYIFSKKNTGDEALDELLAQIVRLNEDKKSMHEVMKEVEGDKILAKIYASLVQKQIIKVKKNVFSTKYELLDGSSIQKTYQEAQEAFKIVDERGRDESKTLTPSTYALISLVACNGGSLKKELLEDRDITEATMEILSQIELRQGGVVTVQMFERIYHMLSEFQK
jgi:uncharacterized protein (UPF0335 family)